jgi:uncharacterized protein (TIGR02147 family)
MAFLIYEYTDYKQVIKERIKDLKKTKPKFSLQMLSGVLEIQYTFLSKVMNSTSHQLSEDQVFLAGYTLDFLDEEVEYLQWLRSYQATQNKARKDYLFRKISTLQKSQHLSLKTEAPQSLSANDDMRYLMDHQACLVHVALWIKALQKNPFALSSYLGVDHARMKDILVLLDRQGRIEFDTQTNQVKQVISPRVHFGKDHPLMRTHQLIMKTALTQMSFMKSEDKKENMFVTFTTNPEGFDKIKKQIKIFMTAVQKICLDGQHTGVYQMNLDFLEIFEMNQGR